MHLRRWLPLLLFGLLAAGAGTGLLLTRSIPAPEVLDPAARLKPAAKPGTQPRRERLVDESPLLTARALAILAVTDQEKQLARQVERLANHEVDLAFTDLLRQAAENPPAITSQSTELLAQKDVEEKPRCREIRLRGERRQRVFHLRSSISISRGATDRLSLATGTLRSTRIGHGRWNGIATTCFANCTRRRVHSGNRRSHGRACSDKG